MSKEKKKFKDWGVTKFVSKNAPMLAGTFLDTVGDLTGVSILSTIGEKIKGSDELTHSQKETALELLKFDIAEMEEISKRWESDMTSDSWLSKNVRPMMLIFLTFIITLLMFTDSIENWSFDVKPDYIDLMKALLITVYFAYFGSRGAEKYKKIGK